MKQHTIIQAHTGHVGGVLLVAISGKMAFVGMGNTVERRVSPGGSWWGS